MFIFFEIPILFIVFIIAGILGLELGPILICIGLMGFILGLFFVVFADEDKRFGSACIFLLPNVLLIMLGIGMGDASVFDVVTDFLF